MAIRDWLLPWRRPLSLSGDAVMARQPGVAAQEIGTAGTENFGGTIRHEDYNPEFDDFTRAVKHYDQMRRSDGQVKAILQAIKLPLRAATWTCHPASNDPVDRQIADFCTASIFADDATQDHWDYILRHILLQLEFGVSLLEKVWKVDERGYYRFKRLAPRLPKTLREFHVDREGSLVAVVQYAAVPNGAAGTTLRELRRGGGSTTSYQYLVIPADYCCLFSLEREGDNYEGQSILRSIYRNWYFKDQAYRVMGVGLDRWGVGIPVAQLEEGHRLSMGDREHLRNILQSVRSNEKAFMVLPEHVSFSIEPSGSGQGTQGGFGIQWIEHHDGQMARSVLASFLTMGRDSYGTLGFGSRLTDLFISSLNGVAAGIAADIKKSLVEPLCKFNFDMSGRPYPEPVCVDLEQVDLGVLVNTIARLTGTLITPQDDDESILRKMLGLPPLRVKNPNRETATKPTANASAGRQPSTEPSHASSDREPSGKLPGGVDSQKPV